MSMAVPCAPVFGNAPGLGGFVDHGCHLEHGVECVITRDHTAGGRNVGSALVSGEDEGLCCTRRP